MCGYSSEQIAALVRRVAALERMVEEMGVARGGHGECCREADPTGEPAPTSPAVCPTCGSPHRDPRHH